MSIRPLKWILLGPVSALLLFGHGFSSEDDYDEWQTPSGQPPQMSSRVDYDPKLTDPFFKSKKWSYPWYIIKHPDGHFEDITSDKRPEKEPPRLKHTAKCRSTSLGSEHSVEFCEARLVDQNTINFLIHHDCPGFNDKLKVQVRNGMFSSQYWTFYKAPGGKANLIWITKRQELVLDKKEYRKGDVMEGRIDFECVQEATNPQFVEKWGRNPTTIKVYGVFKTTVK